MQFMISESVYIAAHVVALVIGVAMLGFVLVQPNSRAQMAVTFFMTAGVMYIVGFLLEITTHEVAGVFTATKQQYFSESLVMLAITICGQELHHTRIPIAVYIIEAAVSAFTLFSLFSYPNSHLMYGEISINTTAGAFPRMEITGYGIAFYLFVATYALVCLMLIGMGIHSARISGEMQRKRLRLLLLAMLSMWMALLVKVLGWTNGYEIPALFIPLAAFFLERALVKYDFLDSVTLDFHNALNQGKEGVLVVDRNHRVLYHNEQIKSVFGHFHQYDSVDRLPELVEAFNGEKNTLEKDGHTYELRLEPLLEQGHHTGDILWVIDLTEHYAQLSEMEAYSTHDDLTGLHTRQWFEDEVKRLIESGHPGAFFMTDLDHFKAVNDEYGHQVGDAVLKAVASAVSTATEDMPRHTVISGRLGGDEFCLFYRDVTDAGEMSRFATRLIYSFDDALDQIGYDKITSISVGISAATGKEDYALLYERADDALYEAKEAGRKTYRFYQGKKQK